ncbi:MAG: phosphoribosylamine--glycine ligase [Bacteroidetes bacterium]|nr:MAG: phosphoribosylamine--glycine ligase [Bacteroidota bacterium]
MNILLLGSGGREHALAWKMKQSPLCEDLFVMPGNAGTAQVAQNVDIALNNFSGIAHFVIDNLIDLVVVGPEEPLVKGLRDFFALSEKLRDIPFVGPSRAGAQLEGSKDFAKEFMHKHKIPTASSRTFTLKTLYEGLQYVEKHTLPVVLKADGLAAGKGVIIATDTETAKSTLKEMLENKKFGEASEKVVIEQYLDGIELSVFVLTDGEHYHILPTAKDYKRVGEGDTGLNTGGMGAVSPVPFADATFMQKVETKIIKPTLAGLKADKIDYIGFIFIGLMNVKGEPYIIEYNVRMGDPETEAVIPRLKTDLVSLLAHAGTRTLDQITIEEDERVATTIVLVSGGYPETFQKGFAIEKLDEVKDALVFHAGTSQNPAERVLTNGGRVIAITALADTMEEALAIANKGAETIEFEKKYYRRDIGKDLM